MLRVNGLLLRRLGLLGLRRWLLLLLLGRRLLGDRSQLGGLSGCSGGENSSLLSFGRVVRGGDQLGRTIRKSDDLLAGAR